MGIEDVGIETEDFNVDEITTSEQRDGLKLTGEYSYSDGFFKRTVAYVADENGYRVTKMISEPIGDGPVTNKLGRAVVQMLVSGVETEYAIQASPMIDELQEEISAKNANEEVDSTGPRGSTGPRDFTGPRDITAPRSLENIDA